MGSPTRLSILKTNFSFTISLYLIVNTIVLDICCMVSIYIESRCLMDNAFPQAVGLDALSPRLGTRLKLPRGTPPLLHQTAIHCLLLWI